MRLFSNQNEDRQRTPPNGREDRHQDEQLQEELSELVASGQERGVREAMTNAEEAVNRATQADITGIKLMESGRCPACHNRVENFVYTTVCGTCGWYRRRLPDHGRCVVHLQTGEELRCDQVFNVTGGQLLCVTDGVVRHQIMDSAVRHVEFVWDDQELAAAKAEAQKLITGACSWCDRDLCAGEEEEAPFVDFVAFGRSQERYVFCSTKCMRQFREHFPSRVHRNCYETDCNKCNKCVKRYDVTGFKRRILN